MFLDIHLAMCEIPQGLIQEPPLSNIFVNNVNDDAGYTISKVVVDNKSRGVTDTMNTSFNADNPFVYMCIGSV